MLGFVLFIIFICLEAWLFGNPNHRDAVSKKGYPVVVVETTPFIEHQMQEIFDVIDQQQEEKKTNSSQEGEEATTKNSSNQLNDDDYSITTIDLDSLTFRQARKVAKALGITQTRTLTIDGKKTKKDKPSEWLIREIKQKVAKNKKLYQTVAKTLGAA